MIILLTVIAIVITGVPLAAVVLVAVASRREETARSIAGCAPRPLERAGRRLLAFHARGIGRPACRAWPGHRGRPAGWPPEDARFLVGGSTLADDPGLASGLALADGARP